MMITVTICVFVYLFISGVSLGLLSILSDITLESPSDSFQVAGSLGWPLFLPAFITLLIYEWIKGRRIIR